MESLSNILYWLSSGLFVPVMLGTVIMFFYSLYMAGMFYGSYKEYARYKLEFRGRKKIPGSGAFCTTDYRKSQIARSDGRNFDRL